MVLIFEILVYEMFVVIIMRVMVVSMSYLCYESYAAEGLSFGFGRSKRDYLMVLGMSI